MKIYIIKDILAAGYEPQWEYVSFYDTFAEAGEDEVRVIAYCRSHGVPICNIHPGGPMTKRKVRRRRIIRRRRR